MREGERKKIEKMRKERGHGANATCVWAAVTCALNVQELYNNKRVCVRASKIMQD